jgi:nucleotide-binding universal stress UspA family protein
MPGIAPQKILAPIDFSPASRQGAGFAHAIASQFHARLALLYVIEPPVLPDWGYAHLTIRDAKLRHAALERLPQFCLECGIGPKSDCSHNIRIGEADLNICEEARVTGADLIVMASHGLGGLKHSLMGSTAERVARLAPCPVLTLRAGLLPNDGPGHPIRRIDRILVPTDFSTASKKALPYAAAFAEHFQASLVLVHVVPSHLVAELSHIGIVLEEKRLMEEAGRKLPQFRATELDPHLPVETLLLNGHPAREICQAAEIQAADLIIMATHGHTGLKHFLLGSITENVIRHAPCPVLVVREGEREFISPS